MANILGSQTVGGFNLSSQGALGAVAAKFTMGGSGWTAIDFECYMDEGWGVGGTLYVALYADNGGVPGAKLWSGSVAYGSQFGGFKSIAMSYALQASTSYWLAWYAKNSSGSYIVTSTESVSTGSNIKKWTESVEGSWTDNPSTTTLDTDRTMPIYVSDAVNVTVTVQAKGRVKKLDITRTVQAKSRVKIINVTRTVQAKAHVDLAIGANLVSPVNGALDQPVSITFVWEIPADGSNKAMISQLQVDDTSNAFGHMIFNKRSDLDSGFEYWNGATWAAYPSTGVTSAYYGNQARITLTMPGDGTYYWRVRGGVN